MPLGMEVGLGPGDIVLDGDAVRPLLPKGSQFHDFQPMSLVAKRRPAQLLLSSCSISIQQIGLANVSEMTYFVWSGM